MATRIRCPACGGTTGIELELRLHVSQVPVYLGAEQRVELPLTEQDFDVNFVAAYARLHCDCGATSAWYQVRIANDDRGRGVAEFALPDEWLEVQQNER